jgi:hypothetical protein
VPSEVNAYYVTTPGSDDGITPGDSLNGFFFQGAPGVRQIEPGLFENDRFLLIRNHDPNVVIEGEQLTGSGMVIVVPEPDGLNLSLLAVASLGMSRALTGLNRSKLPQK